MQQVWYVCYGSNLYYARFRRYLEGGTPPGSVREQPGARDPAAPAEWQRVCLDGSMYFAKHSTSWTGGVAFYDPGRAEPGLTAARAYLITDQQFSDVAAQERGREPGEEIDVTAVVRDGSLLLGEGRGWYDRVLFLGELAGKPMLTVTAPWAMERTSPTRPSAEYLKMVANGLVEAGWYSAVEAGDYLARLPGCAGTWEREAIAALVIPPDA